jgi:GNAT superfamily N-acetyltransferase
MIFHDNVVKEYLKNVYFISGTPCGGKTTVSRELGKRYGITVYDIDEAFAAHQNICDMEHQPNMCGQFRNADEFFGRTADEYKKWLINNTREQLDFVLLDLIRLSQDKKVICDCHLTPEEADRVTESSRVIFLINDTTDIVNAYCDRIDHTDFRDYIYSASDVEKAKAVCNETLCSLSRERISSIKNSDYFYIDRKNGKTIEETVQLAAKHFGLITVSKVERGSALAQELLQFVEECSWYEVKEHIAEMLRKWEFTDWECMFAAVEDGEIVGMASIMKTDYYPLPEIFPWISCIFVTESSRGRRISGELINSANAFAKELGFTKTYIPTEYTGLYEKYGYTYIRDIVNYGGDTDRLYAKEIR